MITILMDYPKLYENTAGLAIRIESGGRIYVHCTPPGLYSVTNENL
jgi:hypothetical protein